MKRLADAGPAAAEMMDITVRITAGATLTEFALPGYVAVYSGYIRDILAATPESADTIPVPAVPMDVMVIIVQYMALAANNAPLVTINLNQPQRGSVVIPTIKHPFSSMGIPQWCHQWIRQAVPMHRLAWASQPPFFSHHSDRTEGLVSLQRRSAGKRQQ